MQPDVRRITEKPNTSPVIQPVAAKFARSMAVVIGINAYANDIPPLMTPLNDAAQVATVLAREQGYDVPLTLTEDVTRAKLVTLFSETLPGLNLGDEDRLLVYFAGHGTIVQGDDGEPEYFLVAQDARAADRSGFLAMRDIREWLFNLGPRHLLVVLDCCFAGGFGRMRALDQPPPKIYRQRYNFYVRSAAWQVIASAAQDETALDTAGGVVFGRRFEGAVPENSPFARALIDALNGQADTNPPNHPGEPVGDGLVTVTELLSFVRDRVQAQADEIRHRQTPALWPLLPKHQAGEYFFGNPQRALQLQDAEELIPEKNPYRGLKPYENDAKQIELFFGRGKQIQQLRDLIEPTRVEPPNSGQSSTEPRKAHSFLAVLGASGTGKSSLVKAGLVPTLSNACVMRPTDAPLTALEKLLGEKFPDCKPHTANFAQDENALSTFVAAWVEKNPGQRLVLVMDQFEELVTLCEDGERKQFQALIANALSQYGASLLVILTCRTDFEPSFANGPLKTFWQEQDARYVVPPMTQDDLRQVIVGPALKREVYFESTALVETLINEVIQTPGGLPLLSFALSEMYLQYIESGRQDRTLGQAEYNAVGGVIGSLRKSANNVYETFDTQPRKMMERIMLRMVAIEGGEVARRRVSTSELDYGAQENRVRDSVIEALTRARLVMNGGEENATWTEPAHDALISGWDRLMGWKVRAAPYLSLQRELAPAALRWQAADARRKTSLLWNNDPRLPQLQETLWEGDGSSSTGESSANDISAADSASALKPRRERVTFLHSIGQLLAPRTGTPTDPQWLNRPEVAFVQASVRRRSLVLWLILGATAAIMVILAGAALITNEQRLRAEASERDAKLQATISDSRRIAAQSSLSQEQGNLDTAVLLGLEARQLNDNYETRNRLLSALGNIYEITSLWGDLGSAKSLVFSPDGKTLASAESDGTIHWWDVSDVQHPQIINTLRLEQKVPITSVAFSPNGQTLASGNLDGTIQLWDLRDVRHPQALGTSSSGHEERVLSVAFSRDGKTLASGGIDTTIRLWNVSDPRHIQSLGPPVTGHTDWIWSVAFAPNGKTLASASGGLTGQDNTIRLWDINDLSHPKSLGDPLRGHSDWVTSLAFNPDSDILASASNGLGRQDHTIRLWDLSDLRHSQALGTPLVGHADPVLSVAFSPDGETLATASHDRTIRLWDMNDREHPQMYDQPLTGHSDSVTEVAFSPDGQVLVSAGNDGAIRVWHGHNAEHPQSLGAPLAEFDGAVWSVAFSPNGKLLASGSGDLISQDYSIGLWDISDSEHLQIVRPSFLKQTDAVSTVAFSPDSKILAAGSWDSKIRLWNVSDIRNPQALGNPMVGHAGEVLSIGFRPDGKVLASGSCSHIFSETLCDEGEIRLWDTSDAKKPQLLGAPISGHKNWIGSVVFSPNGNILASASYDGTIRLWDVSDVRQPQPLDPPITGHADAINSLAFSPDGKTLASASDDITIRLWDVNNPAQPQALTAPIIGHTESVWTVAFSPDGKILASASGNLMGHDFSIRLWDVSDIRQPRVLGTPFTGHAASVRSVAFSPDGKLLASASGDDFTGEDNSIRLWNVDMNIGTLRTRVCTQVNRNLTREEYRQYINSDPTAYDTVYATPENRTCPEVPIETPTPTPTATQ